MEEVQEGGTEQKRKKPSTSNKQMKKCGEPARKGKRGDLEIKDDEGTQTTKQEKGEKRREEQKKR